MADQRSVTTPAPAVPAAAGCGADNGVVGHTVRQLRDARAFAGLAAGVLAADPVGTNVIASVLAGALAAGPPPDAVWVVVEDGEDRPIAVAMRAGRPAWQLGPMGDGAAAAVARALHRCGHDVPGVRGDRRTVAAFARTWQLLSGARGRVVTDEGVRVLTTPTVPHGVPGAARPVGPDDAALVVAWLADFHDEAHPERPGPPADLVDVVRHRTADGTLLLWEDGGRPVSLAGRHPAAAGTARIGPVYTPPASRGHGYAAAVTWAATAAALADGAVRVMLFTDLTNATSNGVYARLGFALVGEACEWTFA